LYRASGDPLWVDFLAIATMTSAKWLDEPRRRLTQTAEAVEAMIRERCRAPEAWDHGFGLTRRRGD